MDKEMFEELVASVLEMDEIVKGKKNGFRRFEFPDPEVKLIRERLGVSQDTFAIILGVSKRTVENWEQGRRNPTGPARSLLRIVEADPEYALRALRASY
jgi:putative transcriptional regulator